MSAAKIRLSTKEQELATSKEFILTKNEIIRKLQSFLGSLAEEQKKTCKVLSMPEELISVSPKISKGENYKGFPWMVLDYPRNFDKENTFAIRTMFWWGHFFSITLHLSGRYKQQFEKKIMGSYEQLKEKNFYCCTGSDQWQHHFENDNYQLINRFVEQEYIQTITGKPFLKIAAKLELNEWNNTDEALLHYFSQLVKVIND